MSGRRLQRKTSVLPDLPPGARAPAVPSPTIPSFPFPEAPTPYTIQVTPPSDYGNYPMSNPWENAPPLPPNPLPYPTRPRILSMQDQYQPRSYSVTTPTQITPFPEPQLFRSTSASPHAPSPPRTHHHTRSDLGATFLNANTFHQIHHNPSVASFASSYNAGGDYGPDFNEGYEEDAGSELARGLSDLQLQSEEGLGKFQAGELAEKDQEWHRLVPEAARDALGKQEVQRQSVLFEIVKSEREYVADLEAVDEVFIQGLRNANPPIIPEPALSAFVQEVFGNLREILSHHQRILGALFERQRDQHPLIQSIADIVLDTTLKTDFRSAYETYIKHYPLAESHHRKELKRNRAYEVFVNSVSTDKRIRKRDLVTFLSRPVTRLPRLNLLLEQVLKLTNVEYEHPDLETLPIILNILKDCIKSTQPGIEAAENKVKFWALCESLVFQKGEIIDMDLYNESRSLVYLGPVYRRSKSDTGFSEKWIELTAALLDNYFILTREEKRPNGAVKRLLMSRPMPLGFLRIGSFSSPSETRREKVDEGGLLDSFRSQHVPIYPFTIYHAANKLIRRYTLYTTSEANRKKWQSAFTDALAIHKVRQEANMWFSPQSLTDGFFKVQKVVDTGSSAPRVSKVTGRIGCAVPFVHASRRYLAVGCAPGVYVAPVNSEQFRWVLNYKNPTSISAITTLGQKTFNRLLIHSSGTVVSFSLDQVSRSALGQSQRQVLDATMERVTSVDANVLLCKHVHVGGRALVVYASKRRLGSSMNLHVLEALDTSEQTITPKRTSASVSRSFRPFGDPGYVPKDAYDIVPLSKTIGICTGIGIVTADPQNLAQSSVAVVPDFQDYSNNAPMATLKANLEDMKPLGFVRVDPNELLVIYEGIGCYIDKHGVPTRRCGYIKWEAKAHSYANRNGHILLISPEFIEIRNITTGRIAQVIEGRDIRLLYSGPYTSKEDPVLVVMRGTKEDQDSFSEKIVELVETEEIRVLSPTTTVSSMWDEWDM